MGKSISRTLIVAIGAVLVVCAPAPVASAAGSMVITNVAVMFSKASSAGTADGTVTFSLSSPLLLKPKCVVSMTQARDLDDSNVIEPTEFEYRAVAAAKVSKGAAKATLKRSLPGSKTNVFIRCIDDRPAPYATNYGITPSQGIDLEPGDGITFEASVPPDFDLVVSAVPGKKAGTYVLTATADAPVTEASCYFRVVDETNDGYTLLTLKSLRKGVASVKTKHPLDPSSTQSYAIVTCVSGVKLGAGIFRLV